MRRVVFAVAVAAAAVGVASPASAATVVIPDDSEAPTVAATATCAKPLKVGKGSIGIDVTGTTARVCMTLDSNSGVEVGTGAFTYTFATGAVAAGDVRACTVESGSTYCVSVGGAAGGAVAGDRAGVFVIPGVCEHHSSYDYAHCFTVFAFGGASPSGGSLGVFVCESAGYFYCPVACAVRDAGDIAYCLPL